MIRFLASLLVVLGLAFAPAMMARVAAAPAPVAAAMDHCNGAMPAKNDGKADAKQCCSTACPSTAALPSTADLAWAVTMPGHPVPACRASVPGLDPERDTPPPRAAA